MTAVLVAGGAGFIGGGDSRNESELGWRARHSDIDTVIRTAMAWQANRL